MDDTPSSPFASEPPTLVNTLQGRSAELVRLWALCKPAQQKTIESVARRLAQISTGKKNP